MTAPARPRWRLTDKQLPFAGIVFIALFAWVVSLGTDDRPEAVDAHDGRGACAEFVMRQLDDRSRAEFWGGPSLFQMIQTASDGWTVTGNVDAENGAGVRVRMSWICQVRLDKGLYVLESLTGLR